MNQKKQHILISILYVYEQTTSIRFSVFGESFFENRTNIRTAVYHCVLYYIASQLVARLPPRQYVTVPNSIIGNNIPVSSTRYINIDIIIAAAIIRLCNYYLFSNYKQQCIASVFIPQSDEFYFIVEPGPAQTSLDHAGVQRGG